MGYVVYIIDAFHFSCSVYLVGRRLASKEATYVIGHVPTFFSVLSFPFFLKIERRSCRHHTAFYFAGVFIFFFCGEVYYIQPGHSSLSVATVPTLETLSAEPLRTVVRNKENSFFLFSLCRPQFFLLNPKKGGVSLGGSLVDGV